MTWPPLWGHYYWLFIHCIGIRYLPLGFSDPKTAYKNGAKTAIPSRVLSATQTLLENLPCRVCVHHAAAYLEQHPFQSISTAQEFILYFFDMHNDVNKRLGKIQITETAMFEQLNLSLVYQGMTVNDVYKRRPNSFQFVFFIPLIYSACVVPTHNPWFMAFLADYSYLVPFEEHLVDSWVDPNDQNRPVSAGEAIEMVTALYNRHCGSMGFSPLDSAELMKRFRYHFSDKEQESTSRAYAMRLEDHRTISTYVDSLHKLPRLSHTLEPVLTAVLVVVSVLIVVLIASTATTLWVHSKRRSRLAAGAPSVPSSIGEI